MAKTRAQLDREIAEALSRPSRPRGARIRGTGSSTFASLFAGWIKKHHGTDLPKLLDLLQELMTDTVERAKGKTTRDKLIKKVAPLLAENLVHRYTNGREFSTWLDDVMERVGNDVASRETLGVHRAYLDSEDPFEVSVRYVGDSQDDDTEVPSHLSYNDLVRGLEKLGGKASCDWSLREIEGVGFPRELHTVYDCRVTFPMKELPAKLFGQQAIEAAADRALATWKTAS